MDNNSIVHNKSHQQNKSKLFSLVDFTKFSFLINIFAYLSNSLFEINKNIIYALIGLIISSVLLFLQIQILFRMLFNSSLNFEKSDYSNIFNYIICVLFYICVIYLVCFNKTFGAFEFVNFTSLFIFIGSMYVWYSLVFGTEKNSSFLAGINAVNFFLFYNMIN